MAGRREGQPVIMSDEKLTKRRRKNVMITRRKAAKTRMYPAMETRMGGTAETRDPKAGKASMYGTDIATKKHTIQEQCEGYSLRDQPKNETPICVTLRPNRARYSSRKVSMKPWGGDNSDAGRDYLTNSSEDCSNEGEEDGWGGEEGEKGSWGRRGGLNIYCLHKPIWGITCACY